jgi:valyl-tRNA synthetase
MGIGKVVFTTILPQLKGTNMFDFVGNLDHNGITTELSISRQQGFRGFSRQRLGEENVRERTYLFFFLSSL